MTYYSLTCINQIARYSYSYEVPGVSGPVEAQGLVIDWCGWSYKDTGPRVECNLVLTQNQVIHNEPRKHNEVYQNDFPKVHGEEIDNWNFLNTIIKIAG